MGALALAMAMSAAQAVSAHPVAAHDAVAALVVETVPAVTVTAAIAAAIVERPASPPFRKFGLKIRDGRLKLWALFSFLNNKNA